jgi:SAM-dependent methyltransferase
VDLYNKTYHPRGKVPPKDFRFPYPDASFDFAFLTSVFTHMLPDDVAHYAREIARTLRPGGTALATFFLLNNESLRLKDTKASSLSIRKPYLKGQVLVYKRWRPEAAVAYPEETVRRIFRESGLLLREPILFGTWCGRETGISFQDIVIAENPTNGKTYCPQI